VRGTPAYNVFVIALVAASASIGCDEGTTPPTIDDVIYEGVASDEAWVAIAEATPTDDSSGWLFAPTSFARAATPPSFTWSRPAGARRQRRTPPLEQHDERPIEHFARGLAEFLHPVAHAHLPPVSGDVYRLVFTIPGDAAPLRVLTTDPSYTPAGSAFTKLGATTGPISLELVRTYLMDNRVMEGPFRLPTITITAE
jgi:hypothetical protein